MTNRWVQPDRLFDGTDIVAGVAVRLEDGHIAECAKGRSDAALLRGCLSPGFIDLQVNGGGGVLLNTTPKAPAMAQIANAHRRFGTTAILPTVITDAPEILSQAAEAAITANGTSGLIGLHIEGPHISMQRRGTHDASHVRPMDDQTLRVVSQLRTAEVPVMITLAPEAATQDQIAALAAMGAVVSIGHTDSTAEQTEAAIAAGATCATHLFNAMSPMQSRAPGAVGAILNAEINFGFICDGHHVDDRMIRLALRAASQTDRAFLVSDAMATVAGPDKFQLYGREVHLQDGKLINAEGSLAGAHITQSQGVQRLVNHVGTTPAEALRLAISNPAKVIGLPHLATLIGRPISDVIVLGEDLEFMGSLPDLIGRSEAMNAAE